VTSEGFALQQSNESWRSNAIYRFCFDGKTVKIDNNGMSVECDKLDEEFLRLAKHVPAKEYKVWAQIYEMLDKGKERSEVLNFLQTYAIARGLR
jgi:hypothetical protein